MTEMTAAEARAFIEEPVRPALLATVLVWATRIGGRYMGADRAEEFGRRNAVEAELLVRVTPTRIVSRKNVSD